MSFSMSFFRYFFSILVSFAAVSGLGLGSSASAGDWDWNPTLHGEIEIETPFTYQFDTDSRDFADTTKRKKDNNLSNFYSECDDCILRFGLTPAFGVVANIGLEPISEEAEYSNIRYNSMILYAQELYLRYTSNSLFETRRIDEVGLFGGKFNPDFGLQNGGLREENEFPGIFSEEYMEDYEMTEMIGFGGDIALDLHKVGSHSLTAGAFYKDNSFLATTFLSDRNKNRTGYGGVANTGSPNSFWATLQGEDIAYVPGLRYELGFMRLHKGNRGGRDRNNNIVGEEEDGFENGSGGRPVNAQTSYAAALVYNKAFFLPRPAFKYPLDVKFMFEYAKIIKYAGLSNAFEQNRDYYTPTVRFRYGPWEMAFIYSRREITPTQRFDADHVESLEDNSDIELELTKPVADDMFEVNLGYRLTPSWLLQASWAYMEEYEEGKPNDNQLVGLQLDYRFTF